MSDPWGSALNDVARRRCHPRPAKTRRPARSYHRPPDAPDPAALAAHDDSLF